MNNFDLVYKFHENVLCVKVLMENKILPYILLILQFSLYKDILFPKENVSQIELKF